MRLIYGLKYGRLNYLNFACKQQIDDKNEYISDYYGKYGNLINIGDYYLFQPVELNDKTISIFERSTPIPFKRDKINVKVLEKVGLSERRGEKEKEENTSGEYENVKNIISSIS